MALVYTERTMQVATHTIDPRIARIHYADYMKKCREGAASRKQHSTTQGRRVGLSTMEREDVLLKDMYRELSKGMRILSLPSTIRDGGLDAEKLPKLAICRASADWCRLERFSDNGTLGICFYDDVVARWSRPTISQRITIPAAFSAPEVTNFTYRRNNNLPELSSRRAMVPSIPAYLRPVDIATPNKYFILWEAEWTKAPPVDPILLRRVSKGDNTNWVVLAQWDLTPLEQSMLAGRPAPG